MTVEQRLIGAKKDPDQEALEHGMLLSQQEAEFGVNMYDSLTPTDESIIEDYLKQGFTREESILILFEGKFGKVSTQSKDITPAMPTVYKAAGLIGEDDTKIDKNDEPQILLLMSRGYTREQAIQVFIQKRKSIRQFSQSLVNIDRSIPPRFPTNFISQQLPYIRQPIPIPVTGSNVSSSSRPIHRISSSSSMLSSSYQEKTTRNFEPSVEEENDMESFISRGYTSDQARQMSRRLSRERGDSGIFNRNTRSAISSVTDSSMV